jgi:hypothetical protein
MKAGARKEISNRSGVAHGVTAGMCLTADGTMMERVYKVMEIQRKACAAMWKMAKLMHARMTKSLMPQL